jgi:hypothetical protein
MRGPGKDEEQEGAKDYDYVKQIPRVGPKPSARVGAHLDADLNEKEEQEGHVGCIKEAGVAVRMPPVLGGHD